MSSAPPARFREKAQVLDEAGLDRALTRIAHEILERNGGAQDLTFVGLRTRGIPLARRLAVKTAQIDGAATVPVGTLDITLYRDDLDLRGVPVIRGAGQPPQQQVAPQRHAHSVNAAGTIVAGNLLDHPIESVAMGLPVIALLKAKVVFERPEMRDHDGPSDAAEVAGQCACIVAARTAFQPVDEYEHGHV
jgi:hypothetical protein